MNRSLLCSVSLLLSSAAAADVYAGPINPGDFQGNQVVVDYNDLGLDSLVSTPLVIAGDTYTTNNDRLRYHTSFGDSIGRSGEGIASDTSLGFIDILLGTPVFRAGLYIGLPLSLSVPFSANVDFFDTTDGLLGTVPVANASSGNVFAGWEADVGLIGRIRITDILDDNFVISMDDLIKEAAPDTVVPEPTSATLFGFGLIGAFTAMRRRKRSSLA